MTRTRHEHLAWCKARALGILDADDPPGAIASMLSDLTKWTSPLYEPGTLQVLAADALFFCRTAADVRNWIEGFA